MSAFTEAELAYLGSQPLMRFATASASGKPDVAPVIFEVEGDAIVTAGFDITHTVRYRNIQNNPRAPRFRITPEVIISWAINDTTPGIPKMERREVPRSTVPRSE